METIVNKLKKFAVVVSGLVVVLAFQNCGQADFRASKNQDDTSLTSLKIASQDVSSTEDLSLYPPRPKITYVIPKAIDFGRAYSGHQPCIYVAQIYPPPPCDPRMAAIWLDYSFQLDLATGVVTERVTGDLLYKLNTDERRELRAILTGTILTHYNPPEEISCLAIAQEPYARLITNVRSFELGAGSPGCAFDLYKRATLQNAGLSVFLEKLESNMGVIAVAWAN